MERERVMTIMTWYVEIVDLGRWGRGTLSRYLTNQTAMILRSMVFFDGFAANERFFQTNCPPLWPDYRPRDLRDQGCALDSDLESDSDREKERADRFSD